MMTPDLFNIYWIDLSPTKGHEQNFKRPGLVIANHPTGLATIIPLTTTLGAKSFPYTQKIQKNSTNLLSDDSVALIFQMRSVDFRERNRGRLGKIEGVELELIKTQIKLYLNLS